MQLNTIKYQWKTTQNTPINKLSRQLPRLMGKYQKYSSLPLLLNNIKTYLKQEKKSKRGDQAKNKSPKSNKTIGNKCLRQIKPSDKIWELPKQKKHSYSYSIDKWKEKHTPKISNFILNKSDPQKNLLQKKIKSQQKCSEAQKILHIIKIKSSSQSNTQTDPTQETQANSSLHINNLLETEASRNMMRKVKKGEEKEQKPTKKRITLNDSNWMFDQMFRKRRQGKLKPLKKNISHDVANNKKSVQQILGLQEFQETFRENGLQITKITPWNLNKSNKFESQEEDNSLLDRKVIHLPCNSYSQI